MCVEHITYLVLFPGSVYTDHWMHEIYSFYSRISKVKTNNKFPTKQQIYSWTYDKVQDVVNDRTYMIRMIQNCCYDEKYKNIYDVDSVIPVLDSICTEYFDWISEQLSQYGIVVQEDAKYKLAELIESVDFNSITYNNLYQYPIKL